jgi:hypothetical protein
MFDPLNDKSTAMFVALQSAHSRLKNRLSESHQSEEGLAVVEIVIIIAIVAAATIGIVAGIMALTEGRAKEIKYAP